MTDRQDRTGAPLCKVAAVDLRLKSASEDMPHGGFEALVAVFGNLDSQGDVVVAGAFAATLTEWGDRPIPSLWSHQMRDPDAFIGKARAEETSDGLLFRAAFLDTATAQHVRQLMAEGLVTEFSWSGRIREGAWVETDDDFYYEIRAADLWEAGPTFKGANPDTELLSVKAALPPGPPPPAPDAQPDPEPAPETSGAVVIPPHLKARLALSTMEGRS